MDDFARVKAAVDIATVVGRYVSLKKAGSRLVGLCPFHTEKTPSFGVVTSGQYFKCFGCGKGGDIFIFLQEFHRIDAREALAMVAAEAGISLSEGEKSGGRRARLLAAAMAADRFYREALRSVEGRRCVELLKRRGLRPELARDFGLGYAPRTGGGFLAALRRQGIVDADIESAGLARVRHGTLREWLLDRLVIPIRDEKGRPIAFGGRRLEDSEEAFGPKYLNSPETPLFQKSRVLFGVDRARPAILRQRRVVLVEGYLDVILAHQAGLDCTVAALGTAVTAEHARMLRRLAESVDVFLDGDAAGRRAATRAIPLLLDAGLRVRVVALEEGVDPGDYFQSGRSAADFEERCATARGGLDYLLEQVGVLDASSMDERLSAARRALEALSPIQDPLVRATALQVVAKELDLPAESLASGASRAGPKKTVQAAPADVEFSARSRSGVEASQGAASPAQLIAEEELLIALLHQPELREVAGMVLPDGSITQGVHQRLLGVLIAAHDAGIQELLDRFTGDGETQRVLTGLIERPLCVEPGSLFDGAVRFFERQRKAEQGRRLKERYDLALRSGDGEAALRFLNEYQAWRTANPRRTTGASERSRELRGE